MLGMAWAGVNVQHNLLPSGDMSDPLYWISYGIEAMISIPIIVGMIAATTAAEWGRSIDRKQIAVLEVGLLALTLALNAGPYFAAADYGQAGLHAVAPDVIAVAVWGHAGISKFYASLIAGADVDTTENTATSSRAVAAAA